MEIIIVLFDVLNTDEDRLSKRKSIGDTVSLQLEMESRQSPEKEQVHILTFSHVYAL